MKTLYKNLNIIDKNGKRKGDILIEEDKISKINDEIEELDQNTNILDCSGLTIMPGFIDTHSHLRDPGFTYKEDLESGLKAAAKGGFTTVCAMANTNPVTDTARKVQINLDKAQDIDLTNLIQVAAVTYDFNNELTNFDELSKVTPILSNDGKNIDDSSIMKEALKKSSDYNIIIATHNEPETETVIRDIELLKEVGGRLHICHISKKETLEAIKEAKEEGLSITCEVTPHHVHSSGLDFKVHPPFRDEEDRLFLIEGIKEGLIDTLGTDHAPHSKEDKENGSPGLINYESAFGMYNKVFTKNSIPLTKLSEMFSYNPAKLLGLDKGVIEEGKTADLVIVDPDKKWILEESGIISKSKNTPFLGEELLGKVILTLRDGKVIYNSEELGTN